MTTLFQPSRAKTVHLDQWIEIDVVDGHIRTSFYPSNQELEKVRQTMNPPPDFIRRRLYFTHEIPPGYQWAKLPKRFIQWGRLLHLVPATDWGAVMILERATQNKHVIPPPFKTPLVKIPRRR